MEESNRDINSGGQTENFAIQFIDNKLNLIY